MLTSVGLIFFLSERDEEVADEGGSDYEKGQVAEEPWSEQPVVQADEFRS